MEIQDYIANFADQFDETEPEAFKPSTNFRQLEEWSSLTGLAVLNMTEKKYGVVITFSELRNASTIEDLFNLVSSKQ